MAFQSAKHVGEQELIRVDYEKYLLGEERFILKEDKTPTSIGASCDKLVLVGVQSPSKIKPPADYRGAQMYRVMQSMTRTSQQVRRGVLELKKVLTLTSCHSLSCTQQEQERRLIS